MERKMQDTELFREYVDLVHGTQEVLRGDDNGESWQKRYAGYMEAIQKNLPQARMARKAFPKDVRPFRCYTRIGNFTKSTDGRPGDFDLRFLGQSVGKVRGMDGSARLLVDAKKDKVNQDYFGWPPGDFEDDWPHGEKSRKFWEYFENLAREDKLLQPRQVEHMLESALFTELEKEAGASKELTGIQPITVDGLRGTRFHMKTALRASDVHKTGELPRLSPNGGEIDIFCRWRRGNQSRLTVIELKKDRRQFQNVLGQAIAYAVFIRELARSPSGPAWMQFWRPHNKPWEGESLTINAVAAMPMPAEGGLSFAGIRLPVEGGGPTDFIELHWIGLTGPDPESWSASREAHAGKEAEPVRFATSLGTSKSTRNG